MNKREEMFAVFLAREAKLTSKKWNYLYSRYRSFERIFRLEEEEICKDVGMAACDRLERAKAGKNVFMEYEKMSEKGIRMVAIVMEHYPDRLRMIPNAPFFLFYKGKLPRSAEHERTVAVIGARNCSEYGRSVAKYLGTELGSHKISVISGMAKGIDGISQMAAIKSGQASYALLGSGVDICYPPDNKPLYEALASNGGIVSEYPPGVRPLPAYFAQRNRLISGMADALIVVEAREKSGTFITVDMALEQGKEVYVIPGRITDPLSVGCNRLIRQGASPFVSMDAFLEEFLREGFSEKLVCGSMPGGNMLGGNILDEDLMRIWEELDYYPRSVEEIYQRLMCKSSDENVNVPVVFAKLMELVQLGKADVVDGIYYVRVGI